MMPNVPDVIEKFRNYCGRDTTGRSLHIVLVDGNLDDKSVLWCRDNAADVGDLEGAELAEILLKMSKTQRGKIARLCWSS